jgi:hypothetical protein
MRSMRQRLAAVTLIGGLTTLGLGLAAAPVSASRAVDPLTSVNTCTAYIGDAQSGSLHMNATPAAGTVPAGSDVSLDVSWDEADFNETEALYVCGTVDGLFDAALSEVREAVSNDGSLTHDTSLPADLPADSEVCFLAALEGPLADLTPGEMVSETICYRTPAAVPTTTPAAPQAPEVEQAVTEAGTTSAPAVEVPVVLAETAVNPAPAVELPRTGEGLDLAGVGGIALALGGLARFAGRKRPANR